MGRGDARDGDLGAPFFRRAARAVQRALELDAALPEAHNAKARGLIAEGNFREAENELEQALAKTPTFDAAWANLGRARQGMGAYAQALAAFKRAIQVNPASFRNYISSLETASCCAGRAFSAASLNASATSLSLTLDLRNFISRLNSFCGDA